MTTELLNVRRLEGGTALVTLNGTTYRGDLRDPGDVERLQRFLSAHLPPEIVVNLLAVAGETPQPATAGETQPEGAA